MNKKKNFIFNAVGSTIYSLLSLFFLIIVTRINGVDDAGNFSFAFTLACLLMCIGNYSTRTFQVTETDKEIDDYDFIYHRFITCFIMIIVAVFYSLIQQYDLNKVIIILLITFYKVIESLSDVFYGIIQKNDHLYKVGISMIIKFFVGLIAFVLTDITFNNLILSICMLNVFTFLVFFYYDVRIIKHYQVKYKSFNISTMKKMFKIGFNPFVYTFLSLYVMSSSRYAIDSFLNINFQTVFGILFMPTTVLVLLSQFIIQPFLNSIRNYIYQKKYLLVNNIILKLSVICLFIGFISICAAYFFGIPVLSFIYGVNLHEFNLELLIVLLGAVLYSIVFILSTVLTAMRITRSQLIIYSLVSILALFLSGYLTLNYNLIGAACSYFILMLILLISYCFLYFISIKKQNI